MFHRHNEDEPPPGRGRREPGRRSRSRAGTAGEPGRAGRPEAAGGGADAQEQFIIDALDDLRDTVVREIMTPRVDVVALPIPLTADDVTRAVRESGHSCFPVYDDNLDNLIGVLFVNDLFRSGWSVRSGRFERHGTERVLPGGGDATGQAGSTGRAARGGTGDVTGDRGGDTMIPDPPDPVDISRRLRQPFLVPESRLVLDVLAEMRRQRRAFAVVVDEHGGVEGVLTVKDLLGALVGDLPDEFDPADEPELVRVDGDRWLVAGRMNADDVREQLGIAIPEGEYVTLGGYLFDAFGHIPVEGERVTVDGWELQVTEMDKRRIAKVVAKRGSAGGSPDGAGTRAARSAGGVRSDGARSDGGTRSDPGTRRPGEPAGTDRSSVG